MVRTFSIILFFAIAVGSNMTHGQTLDDAGLWFAALGNGKFENLDEDAPQRWWFDAHYRLRVMTQADSTKALSDREWDTRSMTCIRSGQDTVG